MTTQSTNSVYNGKLDPTFGFRGVAYFNQFGLPANKISSRAFAIDEQGSCFIVGTLEDDDYAVQYFCLKLTSAGSIDKKFGNDGYVSGQFDAKFRHSFALDIKLLSDKKILIVGDYRYPDSNDIGLVLTRLNSDGTLDTEFGIEGKVILKPGVFDTDSNPVPAATSKERVIELHSTTIMPDGKIVLVTQYRSYRRSAPVIIKLLPKGNFDLSFNKNGFVEVVHPDFRDTTFLYNFLLTTDGKYALVGGVEISDNKQTFFAQLKDDGETDTSFGNDGYLVIKPGTEASVIYSLFQQPDKRILGVGLTSGMGLEGLLISREPNGSENTQFNGGEPVVQSLRGLDTTFSDAYVNPDNSILVLGNVKEKNKKHSTTALARFTHEGKIDSSYAQDQDCYLFDFIKQVRSPGVYTRGKLTFLAMIIDGREEKSCIVRALTD